VGHESAMRFRDREVIELNGYEFEQVRDEFCSTGSVSLVGELDSRTQFGNSDGGDDHIVVVPDRRPEVRRGALDRDQNPGVEDQSPGHAGTLESTDSRAARTSSANPSSKCDDWSNASTPAPFPLVAGPIVAIRRPPRVTITV